MDRFSRNEIISLGFDYLSNLVLDASLNNKNVNVQSREPFKAKDPFIEYASSNDLSKAMYGFFADARDFSKLPNVLSDEEFDAQSGTTFFHGFKKPKYANDFLNNFLYHYGNGLTADNQFINGFYLAKRKTLAKQYTAVEIEDTLDDNVLSIKLENQKVISISEIRSLVNNENADNSSYKQDYDNLLSELENLKEQTQNSRMYKLFRKAIMSNYSTIAVLLGAGILIEDEKTYNKENNEQVIVLNRSAVAVKESEVAKILGKLQEKEV